MNMNVGVNLVARSSSVFRPIMRSSAGSRLLVKRVNLNIVRGIAEVATDNKVESIIDVCLSGPLEKSNQKNTILPFVFLLGNHSSGKSSFVNYILQRKVTIRLHSTCTLTHCTHNILYEFMYI
jgi:polynucleotide 5'-kinase involved in rRNA processing